MELKKVQIRNFRKNKELNIEFEQITTLRGASGKGKSSALDAIRWPVFGRPLGTSLINWDSKHAAVKLTFNDCDIIRKKSDKENTYKLNGNLFSAVGTDVPEPIQKATNLSTINFSYQHSDRKQEANFSPLFWFSLTAGEVNKELNKIIDLSIIDNTTANIARMKREADTKIKLLKENAIKYKREKEELAFIVEAEKGLLQLEQKEKDTEERRQNLAELTNLIKLAQKYRLAHKNLSNQATEGKIILEKGVLYNKQLIKYEKLIDLISKAKKYDKLRKYKAPNTKPLLEKRKQIDLLIKQRNRLIELIGKAGEYEKIVYTENEKLKEMKIEFNKLMKDKCPLCGRVK